MIDTLKIGALYYYGCYLSEREHHTDRPYNVFIWKHNLWVAHDEGMAGFKLPTWMTMV